MSVNTAPAASFEGEGNETTMRWGDIYSYVAVRAAGLGGGPGAPFVHD
jgi:hypothetical protein